MAEFDIVWGSPNSTGPIVSTVESGNWYGDGAGYPVGGGSSTTPSPALLPVAGVDRIIAVCGFQQYQSIEDRFVLALGIPSSLDSVAFISVTLTGPIFGTVTFLMSAATAEHNGAPSVTPSTVFWWPTTSGLRTADITHVSIVEAVPAPTGYNGGVGASAFRLAQLSTEPSMSQQIPLAPVPSQTLGVSLDGQNCTLSVFQRGAEVYMSLAVDGTSVLTTKACRTDIRLLLASRYLGFRGDFVFVDTQGDGAQPDYAGFGTRWALLYLTPADVAL